LKDNLFTIIVPVKNGYEDLPRAIESVIQQTYINFKIIILLNVCTDKTKTYLKTIQKHYPSKIKIIEANTSLTIEENWSRALNLNLSGYVTFAGHDDYFDKDFLFYSNKLINYYPDAGLYRVSCNIVNEKNKIKGSYIANNQTYTFHTYLLDRLNLNMFQTGTGYVFKYSDFQKIGGFDKLPGLLYSDDMLFLKLIKNSYMATTNKKLCFVTLRKSSESGFNHKNINNFISALKSFNYYIESNLLKEEYDFIKYYIDKFNKHALKKILFLVLINLQQKKLKFNEKLFNKSIYSLSIGYKQIISKSIFIKFCIILFKVKLLNPLFYIYKKIR
jgi:glycosyltransferase involved in cell wall biosynthesis